MSIDDGLVDFLGRMVGNDYVGVRKNNSSSKQSMSKSRASGAPSSKVHQKIVNLKGAAVRFRHHSRHGSQLAVAVSLVEILEVQVGSDALDFAAHIVFEHVRSVLSNQTC